MDAESLLEQIPDKPRLYVSEVARIIARFDDRNQNSVKRWLYRAIDRGEILTVWFLGKRMIPRQEVERIIRSMLT